MTTTLAELLTQDLETEKEYLHGDAFVRIFDKNMGFLCSVTDYISLTFDEKVNAAGGLDMVLDPESLAAEVLRDIPEGEVIRILVDLPNYRWSGNITSRVMTVTRETDQYKVEALHDWQHFESIVMWSNPWAPAQFQPMHQDFMLGPACTVISVLLAKNLARLQLQAYQIPIFSHYNFDTWNIVRTAMWPIAVKPINPLTDTSRWTIATPSFDLASTVINELCAGNDSGLVVKIHQWLPGEEQPWMFAGFTRPTLWVEVVDYGIEKHFTGTALDGLITVGLELVEDTIEFLLFPILGNGILGEDDQGIISEFLMKKDAVPIYRQGGLVKSHEQTIHSPLASQVILGGKSPEWVNQGIEIGITTAFSALATAIASANPAFGPATMLAGPLGQLVASQMKDTVLAYFAYENLKQAIESGPFRYREALALGGTGFSLQLYQDIVNACYKQRAYTSHVIEVENGSPHVVNRDIELGRLAGVEIPYTHDKKDPHLTKVHVTRLTEISWTDDRNTRNQWTLKLGDPTADLEPGQRSLQRIRGLMEKIDKMATNGTGGI